MKALHIIAWILVVIGGLNWLLIGLGGETWNVVALLGMTLAKSFTFSLVYQQSTKSSLTRRLANAAI